MGIQNLSDEVLIARAKAGEHEAVDELSRRYAKRAAEYCRVWRVPRDDAEDAVSDASIRLFLAIVGKVDIRNIRSFNYRLVENAVCDHYRRVKPTQPLDRDYEDPNSVITELEDRIVLEEALFRLPTREREVMVMLWHGGTIAEIAEVLGLSESMIRFIRDRARELLEEYWADSNRPSVRS